MPRKKSQTRMYFTLDTEEAIVAYNDTDDHRVKNQIYNDHLRKPFEKLVENIIHTFKFYYFDIPLEDVIALSIIELMDRVGSIEIFNKKALYILLREISGYQTQHITRVLNVMRGHYKNLWGKWDEEGDIFILSNPKRLNL